jgi:hypothetical protein
MKSFYETKIFFLLKLKIFRFDYYFQSHQIPENTKNILQQKTTKYFFFKKKKNKSFSIN